jgi:hypothetical protein
MPHPILTAFQSAAGQFCGPQPSETTNGQERDEPTRGGERELFKFLRIKNFGPRAPGFTLATDSTSETSDLSR